MGVYFAGDNGVAKVVKTFGRVTFDAPLAKSLDDFRYGLFAVRFGFRQPVNLCGHVF